MNPTTQRTVIPEFMDRPDAPPEELIGDLRDLMRLNRFGWGRGLVWECVRDVLSQAPGRTSWTCLDVATGAADIPRHLVDRTRRRGVEFHVTAVDVHPVTLGFAREQSRAYPEITIQSANLLSLPFPPGSFDLVTCSQALHHFGSQDIVAALRQMRLVARHAVIVSDLCRSRVGTALVWCIVRLAGGGAFVRHDAPASMRNGFKLREMDLLAQKAGLVGRRVVRHRGLRFAMTWISALPR